MLIACYSCPPGYWDLRALLTSGPTPAPSFSGTTDDQYNELLDTFDAVTVNIYEGPTAHVKLVQTTPATPRFSGPEWSVTAATSLPRSGIYTAQATQEDAAHNVHALVRASVNPMAVSPREVGPCGDPGVPRSRSRAWWFHLFRRSTRSPVRRDPRR